jgi:hypothetical protein
MPLRHAKRACLWLVLTVSVLACRAHDVVADPAEPREPDASSILETVLATYQHLDGYQDTGTVETAFYGKVDYVEKLDFSTAFKRSGKFRFDYQQEGANKDHMVITSDADDVHLWWSITGKEEESKDLRMAIASATGVSHGTAHTIPSILLNTMPAGFFTGKPKTQFYRIADGVENGVIYDRVQTLWHHDAETLPERHVKAADGSIIELPRYLSAVNSKKTYWFNHTSHLLERVDEDADLDTFYTLTTTRYKPQANPVIADSAFTFMH